MSDLSRIGYYNREWQNSSSLWQDVEKLNHCERGCMQYDSVHLA